MNLLLTGRPGCGKTTAVIRLAQLVPCRTVGGFYTQELPAKAAGAVGFAIRTFGGHEGVLAHVDVPGSRRVGRYRVDVAGFERLALPTLVDAHADLLIIDEIGKMECFSKAFCDAVWAVLDSDRDLVATIALTGGGFIGRVKARSDVERLELSAANRDGLPQHLAEKLACA